MKNNFEFMAQNKSPKAARSFGTHDGTFHADEVTACALLLKFNLIDESQIFRTRDLSVLNACEYVCDVGGEYDPEKKHFDHHQAEYRGDFSSAGMILLYLKEKKFISEKEYELLNESLVRGVDAHDNGKDPQIPGLCTYSHIIATMVPKERNALPEALDNAFLSAVNFSKALLDRILERYHYTQSFRKNVAEVMQKFSNQKYLIFEENIPWMDSFFELGGEQHSAKFVIMPSENHWMLRGIPPHSDQRMKVRTPLPKEWAGLLDDDLKKVSGIPGAIFCHKGLFFSVWETRDDALVALQKVLKGTNDSKHSINHSR